MSWNTPITDSSQATAPSAFSLRPLSLGELLDRAFHLYFKHFTLFISLLAIVLVPYTIVQYFQSKEMLDVLLSVFTQTVQAPGSAGPSPEQLAKLSQMSGVNGWLGAELAILVLALPFAYAAVVVAVSRVYLGQPATFAECYRAAGRRWLAMFILIVLWIVLAFAGVIGFAICAAILGATFGFLASGLHGSAVAAIVVAIFFIAFTLALIALGMMLYVTVALSFVAVVLERTDPIRAMASAFRRVFPGNQFWRSAGLALSLFFIQIALTLVGYATGGLLAYFLKSTAIYVVVISLVTLLYAPFALLAVGVFYYDVRIRREGFDLQMLAEQLSGTQSQIPTATA